MPCKIWILCLLLFFHYYSLFSQEKPLPEAILQPHMLKKLSQDGFIFQYGRLGIEYLDTAFQSLELKNQFKEIFYRIGANYTVQIIYFAPDKILPARTDLQIYNTLRHVESLSDSYVVRNNRRDPFMTKVYEYEDSKFKERILSAPLIKDPIPFFHKSYFRAKDTRFGTINYTLTYQYQQGRFILNLLNEAAINYLIYPIAEKEKFATIFTAQPVRGGIIYILQTFVSVKNLKTAEDSIDLKTFFSRRLEALKGWYFRRVYGLEVVQGIFPEAIRIHTGS